MKDECIFYAGEIFIEKRFESMLNHDDQRAFIKYCDDRLQVTSTWTYPMLNLLTELECELNYLENTDML